MNARHLTGSPNWGSPELVLAPARATMGSIELDPASDHEHNSQRVHAARIFTIDDDGLSQPWVAATVWLNAPGRQVNAFWQKLVEEFLAGNIEQAIWCGFSLEQLQTIQMAADIVPTDFCTCYPRARIPFVETPAMREERRQRCLAEGRRFSERPAPSHANYITYLGHRQASFRKHFLPLGAVVIPKHHHGEDMKEF